MISRRGFIAVLTAATLPCPTLAQPVDLVLDVRLPSDRHRTGLLTLKRVSGAAIVADLKVLGKADNARALLAGNPQRDPSLPFGDTPTGRYAVPRAVATGAGTPYSSNSYGSNGALVLDPVDGQAMDAKGNGRVGLLIHGGTLGTGSRLRATHGCLRLSDGDMAILMAAIRDSGENPTFQRCEVVNLSVLVGDLSVDEPGSDENDPPLGIEELLGPVQPIQVPKP